MISITKGTAEEVNVCQRQGQFAPDDNTSERTRRASKLIADSGRDMVCTEYRL